MTEPTNNVNGLNPTPASPEAGNRPGAWTAGRRRLIALNVLLMILIAAAIFTGVNYLGNRYSFRKDCTFRQTYALSDKTKNLLSHLTEPVQVYALFSDEHPVVPRLRNLLEEYKMHSPKIIVEEINLVQDPTLANERVKYLRKELKVTANLQPFDTIFVCGQKSKVVSLRDTYTPKYDYSGGMYQQPQEIGIDAFRGEEAFTSALLSVTQAKMTKIYFTEGHGEIPLSSRDLNGMMMLNNILKGENMETQAINLLKTKELPADLDILVVAGPEVPFLPAEISLIRNYLSKGGKALFLVGARLGTNLENLLKEWGIELENNLVIDEQSPPTIVSGRLANAVLIPLVSDYGAANDHPITKDLKAKEATTAFIISRALEVTQPAPADLTIIEIARSSNMSWAKSDIKTALETRNFQFAQGDKKGPLALGLAVQKDASGTRLVVFGSSEMVKDQYLYPRSDTYFGTNDLVLNSIRWLARQEQLVTIEPKKTADTSIDLTKGKRALLLLLVSLLFVPAVGVILGLAVWLIRRK